MVLVLARCALSRRGQALWSQRGQRQIASDHAVPRVRVDGLRNVQEVIAETEFLSEGYSRHFDLITLGQPGIVSAFHVAATIRQNTLAPAFAFTSAQTLTTLNLTTEEDWELERNRVRGKNDDRRRIYCLSFPPVAEWRSESQRQIHSRLHVPVSRTQIKSLAKALTARAATVAEGRAIAVETPLLGEEKLRRLRIAHMAQALAMAHHWELCPADPSKPTRSFRCVAELCQAQEQASAAETSWLLRLEVLPEGPPKPWPWKPEGESS